MIPVKEIWKLQSETAEPYVKAKLDYIKDLNCFAGTILSTGNRVFILEMQNGEELSFPELLKFRGMTVQTLSYDDHKELTILLTDNDLEEIFTSFIENIADEITDCKSTVEALPKIANVILRWKKLFDKAGFAGLEKEQQKGLFGELSLIRELLLENKPATSVLGAWTGPDYKDQDFDFGDKRIEIKLTSLKYPSAKITNERQLSTPPNVKLYLNIFVVEEVKKNGTNLPGLVEEIESLIVSDIFAKEIFKSKIGLSGYSHDDREFYLQEYFLREKRIYEVDDNFPKITDEMLTTGIYNVSYRIELSACEPYRIQDTTIAQLIYGY